MGVAQAKSVADLKPGETMTIRGSDFGLDNQNLDK